MIWQSDAFEESAQTGEMSFQCDWTKTKVVRIERRVKVKHVIKAISPQLEGPRETEEWALALLGALSHCSGNDVSLLC